MRMPNAEVATVARPKLTNYLLSETHPVGKYKAYFFRAVGFNEMYVDQLEESLLNIARSQEVAREETTPHGRKFVIDGLLETPVGNAVPVRTVWFIDSGTDQPRFVTAYPS